MRIPVITCRETTQVLTEAGDRRLSLAERLGLRLHLFVCGPCRNYFRQMKFLDRLKRSAPEHAGDAGTELSAEARDRIRQKLAH